MKRILLAATVSISIGLTGAAALAQSVTVDFQFADSFYGTTVNGTITGASNNTDTPSTDLTFTITGVTPGQNDPYNYSSVIGAHGNGNDNFITLNIVNDVVTDVSNGSSSTEIHSTLSDGSTLILPYPTEKDSALDVSSPSTNIYDYTTFPIYTVVTTPVPAPAALAVFIPALLGLGAARRRRV